MELERKKCRTVKKVYTGPTIRYHSISMPLLGEDGTTVEGRYERTFITFSDANTKALALPPSQPPKPPTKSFCPITREPARYRDPVTQLPFCNIPTFRILREAYYQQLEAKGDRSKPAVAEWLAYRQSHRDKLAQAIRVDPSLIQITKVKEEPFMVPSEEITTTEVSETVLVDPGPVELPEEILSVLPTASPPKVANT